MAITMYVPSFTRNGNDDRRGDGVKRIAALGKNYSIVQRQVNRILKK